MADPIETAAKSLRTYDPDHPDRWYPAAARVALGSLAQHRDDIAAVIALNDGGDHEVGCWCDPELGEADPDCIPLNRNLADAVLAWLAGEGT